ncbi:hypothetical protein Q7P37_003405 [Cladosporium fusiforme]
MVLTSCEIRKSPLHGLGIFATQDIKPGTIVVQERPLWLVSTVNMLRASFHECSSHDGMRKHMLKLFHPPDEMDEVQWSIDLLSLEGGFEPEDTLSGTIEATEIQLTVALREVLIRNGFSMSFKGIQPYAAVYKESSRLNHSCVPNALRTIAPAYDYVFGQVVATAPIAAGEEILVNYDDPLASFKFREELFQYRWKFTCTCKRCLAPEEERQKSDKNRQDIIQAINYIRDKNGQHMLEKPRNMRADVWTRHLGDLNKAMLGEDGWQVIGRLAAEEGVSDFDLWQTLEIVSEAAERSGKLVLATDLLDRLIADTRLTKASSPGFDEGLRERRELLNDKFKAIASVVDTML